LLNLTSNAIKFTEKGQIKLTLECLADIVQIRVQDTGAGIAPDQVERIFEAFRQADNSATRQAGGTGLGLPISRRLVEMHGGRLWVESKVDVGSTFFVELPTELRYVVGALSLPLLASLQHCPGSAQRDNHQGDPNKFIEQCNNQTQFGLRSPEWDRRFFMLKIILTTYS
jgi:hypothetical protein